MVVYNVNSEIGVFTYWITRVRTVPLGDATIFAFAFLKMSNLYYNAIYCF